MQILTIGAFVFIGVSIIIVLKKGFNEVIKGLEGIREELQKKKE